MSRSEPRVGRRFLLTVSIAVALLAGLPWLIAWAAAPGQALGFTVAADDNMVYAAWMRQAMEGRFFFDNRFTIDPQPGLTVHLYFLVLGWIAKIVGIPWALHGVRILLTALFVWRLGRFVERVTGDGASAKLALGVSLVAGGIGWIVWHDFGIALVRTESLWAAGLLQSRLPIDVWQSEAFVFPSLMANGLFVAALLLILTTFEAALDARENWKSVLKGIVALGVLTNIHTYDTVIVAAVLAVFAISMGVRGRLTVTWTIRTVVIGLGVVPAALWLAYVLRNDPVFQSRAATPTFAALPRAMIAGLFFPIGFAVFGLWDRKRIPGFAALAVGLAILIATATPSDGYPVPAWAFAAAFVSFAVAAVVSSDGESEGMTLVICWAFVGLALPYFPALFERKLAMGLALPWGILAARGLGRLAEHFPVGTRRLPLALAAVVLGASAIRWFARDLGLVRANVATTVVHPITLSKDAVTVLDALSRESGKKIAVAAPGGPNMERTEAGEVIPDRFGTPVLPDLNPMLAGLGGAYAPAGHWSETPRYDKRRSEVTTLFASPEPARREEFAALGITHTIVPVPEAFPGLPDRGIPALGTEVVRTPSYVLVRFD